MTKTGQGEVMTGGNAMGACMGDTFARFHVR